MRASLLEGVDEVDRDEAKADFVSAFRFRKNLSRVLEKEIQSLIVNMCDEDMFSKDWPLIQADRVAQIKAKRKLISLLE
jgi:hypothetical protein